MTEREFFATGGPVDEILTQHAMPKYGKFGREAMLESWFNASTDHKFDAHKTAMDILEEAEMQASFLGTTQEEL